VVQAYYKDAGFAVHSKQLTLDAPTDSTQKLYETGVELFDLLWQEEPIRLMGLSGARAESGELEQLNFFDMEKSEKRKKLDTAIDEVRNRFGAEAITRASLLDQTDRKKLSRK
jgi:DNA polymerase-4